jgi:hypothetical protein
MCGGIGLQPSRERHRVEQVQHVADMDQLEDAALADAVGAGERAARSGHARDLGECTVLELERWDVVEHREAHGSREAPILERQPRRVALDDLDGSAERAAQALAVALVQLERGQLGHLPAEDPSGGAESGADLEHVVTQLDPLESPRQQLVLDTVRPPA